MCNLRFGNKKYYRYTQKNRDTELSNKWYEKPNERSNIIATFMNGSIIDVRLLTQQERQEIKTKLKGDKNVTS